MKVKTVLIDNEIWVGVQFTGVNQAEIEEWSNGAVVYTVYDSDPFKFFHFMDVPIIKDCPGENISAKVNDWILKKPNGNVFKVLKGV